MTAQSRRLLGAIAILSVFVSGLSGQAQVEVIFPDPGLEAVIREALGEPLNPLAGPIFDTSLESLTDLTASFENIQNLSGIEAARNLTTLSLEGNSIANPGPLAALVKLESLNLQDNALMNIGPLAGLSRLNLLNVIGNSVGDIGPVAGLTDLTRLFVSNNQIVDIGPVQNLVNLEHFLVGGNQVVNLGPLMGLTSLLTLRASNNQIVDLAPLALLTNLVELNVQNNQIVDVEPLATNATLPPFSFLHLNGNPLSCQSIQVHIPAIQAGNVDVFFDNVCNPGPTPTPGPRLLSVDPNERFPLPAGDAIIALTYSEAMMSIPNPTVIAQLQGTPDVFQIIPSPGWISQLVWYGAFPVSPVTPDGIYTVRVTGAQTQAGLSLPENTQFQLRVTKEIDSGTGAVALTGSDSLLLGWEPADKKIAASYEIWRATASIGPYMSVGVVPGSITEFTDLGLEPATTYFYRVIALNTENEPIARSDEFQATTAQKLSNGYAVAISVSAIRLTWSPTNAPNLTGTLIRRSQELAGPFVPIGLVSSSASVATATGLCPGRPYFFTLQDVNVSGAHTFIENPFSAVTFTSELDRNGDCEIDAIDLLLYLDSFRKGEPETISVLDFAMDWNGTPDE